MALCFLVMNKMDTTPALVKLKTSQVLDKHELNNSTSHESHERENAIAQQKVFISEMARASLKESYLNLC